MIRAVIFDAFGTLFNLDKNLLQDIDAEHVYDILDYARSKQLSYTWLKSLMQDYIPFDQITRIALQDGCRKYNVDMNLAKTLEKLYFAPVVFDDVKMVIDQLNASDYITGILSNGTHAMLQSGITRNQLDVQKVYSVDDIKKYKPDPEVYQMVLNDLELSKENILFVSSNQWDVAGAVNFGFQVRWLNRGDLFKESMIDSESVVEIKSLEKLLL